MKKSTLFPLLAMSLFFLAACSRPVAVHHQGPATLAVEAKSYALLEHPVGTEVELKPFVQELVRTEMARKGYVEVAKESADVFVSVKTLTRDGDERAGHDPQSLVLLGPAVGSDTSTTDSSKVVVVLLEEAATERVLWVGWSAGEYPRYQVAEKMRESLAEIMTRIPGRS